MVIRYKIAGRFTRTWERVRVLLRRKPRTILEPSTEHMFSYWLKQGDEPWIKVSQGFTTAPKGTGVTGTNFESGAIWGAQIEEAGTGAFVSKP